MSLVLPTLPLARISMNVIYVKKFKLKVDPKIQQIFVFDWFLITFDHDMNTTHLIIELPLGQSIFIHQFSSLCAFR